MSNAGQEKGPQQAAGPGSTSASFAEDSAHAEATNAALRAALGHDGKLFTSAKDVEEAAKAEGLSAEEVCPVLDASLASQDPVHGHAVAEGAADLLLARSRR